MSVVRADISASATAATPSPHLPAHRRDRRHDLQPSVPLGYLQRLACRQPERVPERLRDHDTPRSVDGSPHTINLPLSMPSLLIAWSNQQVSGRGSAPEELDLAVAQVLAFRRKDFHLCLSTESRTGLRGARHSPP